MNTLPFYRYPIVLTSLYLSFGSLTFWICFNCWTNELSFQLISPIVIQYDSNITNITYSYLRNGMLSVVIRFIGFHFAWLKHWRDDTFRFLWWYNLMRCRLTTYFNATCSENAKLLNGSMVLSVCSTWYM